MPQVRMFRDRMVSMEQTLERGEKNLEFLKSLCKEVFPEFEYREHSLDHERDLFVMTLETSDGRRKSVGWTRMVLFDAERLPVLLEDPSSPLSRKLKQYLRDRASRPEIVVTFRHLEEGWVDTPEPRREKRRRRGRGRPLEKREGQRPPAGRPPQPGGQRREPSVSLRPAPSAPPRPSSPAERPAQAGVSAPGVPAGEGRRRRRRFRRRRGRGGSGAAGSPPPTPGRTP